MNLKLAGALFALSALTTGAATPAASGDIMGLVQMHTPEGCQLWMAQVDTNRRGSDGSNPRRDGSPGIPLKFEGTCTPGETIDGKGKVSFFYDQGYGVMLWSSFEGTFIDGYLDGPVVVTLTDNPPNTYEYDMGCPKAAPQFCDPNFPRVRTTKTPAPVAAAEPEPSSEPAVDEPLAEEPAAEEPPAVEQPTEPTEVSEEIEGVNEISEGEVPQQRWLEARRTKNNAPRHHADHDVSNCVGTFWKMHAGTGHYVIYNKCDRDIRVGWCSVGYGGDCVAGKGQIATMEPMVGYTGGLKREETPKYFACSKNIFPVYEGNELVAFSCD
ncbi:hypothetical protein sos41_31830 [Alphaproteobacteria bacterium SO-S41]|nr:hypothetical protein sos41_31830 [Alphaproteobacteria bacterium SO-S41]